MNFGGKQAGHVANFSFSEVARQTRANPITPQATITSSAPYQHLSFSGNADVDLRAWDAFLCQR